MDYVLLINLWQIFQIIWAILSPNNYRNRHFLQFVHIGMIFNLFLFVPKVHFFISDSKSLPSNNKIITFLLINWVTSILSHYRSIDDNLLRPSARSFTIPALPQQMLSPHTSSLFWVCYHFIEFIKIYYSLFVILCTATFSPLWQAMLLVGFIGSNCGFSHQVAPHHMM